jgi:hypothetical protein
MSKEFRLVKRDEFAEVKHPPMDWNLCILCQKSSSESLIQPWKGRGRGKSEVKATGYQSFATILGKFQDQDKVPMNVVPGQFDDGSGIEETLQKNKSKWHRTCRYMFSDLKLDRQIKRASVPDSEISNSSPVKLRRSSIQGAHVSEQNVPICFFCDKEAGIPGLHDVTTMGMDQTVRMYATQLQDTRLLAKLAPGDMVALEAKYHKTCLCDLFNR